MRTPDPGPIAEYAAQALGHPILTAEEELALAREVRREAVLLAAGRIGPGDRPARQRMILANLRLAFHVARWYVGRGVDFADLVQEGNLAIAEAVDSYDLDRPNVRHPGVCNRFGTHATWVIRGRLTLVTGRARMARMADLAAVPEADDAGREDDAARATVAALLRHLDGRSRAVVTMRFGLDDDRGRKFVEIGAALGITKERVRQITSRAIGKMAAIAGTP